MTFGEKLSKLRKENNYTQEQLADVLGVSRQSVSKWESDIAYPETEKLIKISQLFGCTVDYLLNENVENPTGAQPPQTGQGDTFQAWVKRLFRERKSQKTIMGMPLYHVGRDAKGFFAVGLKAKGVFAIGLLSRGVCSLGLLSMGVLSIGLLALGLLALGTLAVGAWAIGCIALGLVAIGAIAVGILSLGALSVGCFSVGALAVGKYVAIGDHAYGMIAVGQSVANGEIFSHLCTLTQMNATGIGKWVGQCLDEIVPWWLSWAKEIFKFFVLFLG